MFIFLFMEYQSELTDGSWTEPVFSHFNVISFFYFCVFCANVSGKGCQISISSHDIFSNRFHSKFMIMTKSMPHQLVVLILWYIFFHYAVFHFIEYSMIGTIELLLFIVKDAINERNCISFSANININTAQRTHFHRCNDKRFCIENTLFRYFHEYI